MFDELYEAEKAYIAELTGFGRAGGPLLQELIRRYKAGTSGHFSVCSANEFVIEALLEFGKSTARLSLVEATCNQVNPVWWVYGHGPG